MLESHWRKWRRIKWYNTRMDTTINNRIICRQPLATATTNQLIGRIWTDDRTTWPLVSWASNISASKTTNRSKVCPLCCTRTSTTQCPHTSSGRSTETPHCLNTNHCISMIIMKQKIGLKGGLQLTLIQSKVLSQNTNKEKNSRRRNKAIGMFENQKDVDENFNYFWTIVRNKE